MNRMFFSFAAALFAAQALAVPEVSGVSIAQDDRCRTRITYSLSSVPAIVTLDVQTNAADGAWISVTRDIGATNFTGDVWHRVESPSGVIDWDPVASWPDVRLDKDAKLRAVVTAYALDDTPDYMVVDLAETSDSRTNYYPSVDLLPGGLMDNPAYRTSKLVLRKVLAKDVPWTMGSVCEPGVANDNGATPVVSEDKHAHPVQLTNNYYLAVFETTHAQFQAIMGWLPAAVDGCRFDTDGEMRPIEQAYPSLVRGSAWPAEPTAGSVLGALRSRTGIDFDLPSEAQWEFACRAGSVDGEFNEGTRWSYQVKWWETGGSGGNRIYCSDVPGRWAFNGGYVQTAEGQYSQPGDKSACGLTNGTVAVGSVYPANAWGFYDMHGNVQELCLDRYVADITGANGAVQTSGTETVVRGGGWLDTHAYQLLSTTRLHVPDHQWQYQTGFRVACRAGLK